MITLTPAYGRDYKSRAALEADLTADRDFIINQFGHPYDGKPTNRSDLIHDGARSVTVRYAKLRRVAVVSLT